MAASDGTCHHAARMAEAEPQGGLAEGRIDLGLAAMRRPEAPVRGRYSRLLAQHDAEQRVRRGIGVTVGSKTEAVGACPFHFVEQRPKCRCGGSRFESDPAYNDDRSMSSADGCGCRTVQAPTTDCHAVQVAAEHATLGKFPRDSHTRLNRGDDSRLSKS
jgi:hypothetical protein